MRADQLQQTESSSTPILDERSPVVQRLQVYIDYVTRTFKETHTLSNKANFFLEKILKELFSEMEDAPPEAIEESFRAASAAAYWVSTGNVIENMPMPEGFWDAVGRIPEEITRPTAPALDSSPNV